MRVNTLFGLFQVQLALDVFALGFAGVAAAGISRRLSILLLVNPDEVGGRLREASVMGL